MAKGISAAISTNAGSSSSAVDASRNPPGWKQNQLQKQSSETRSSDCESFSWYWHGSWTLACTANHGNINIGSSDTWHMIHMIRNFPWGNPEEGATHGKGMSMNTKFYPSQILMKPSSLQTSPVSPSSQRSTSHALPKIFDDLIVVPNAAKPAVTEWSPLGSRAKRKSDKVCSEAAWTRMLSQVWACVQDQRKTTKVTKKH